MFPFLFLFVRPCASHSFPCLITYRPEKAFWPTDDHKHKGTGRDLYITDHYFCPENHLHYKLPGRKENKKKMSTMEITLHVTKASDLPVPCPMRKTFTFPWNVVQLNNSSLSTCYRLLIACIIAVGFIMVRHENLTSTHTKIQSSVARKAHY